MPCEHEDSHQHAKRTGLGLILPSQSSERVNPAITLIWDFSPPELWENRCLLFKPSSLWYCYGSPNNLIQVPPLFLSWKSNFQFFTHFNSILPLKKHICINFIFNLLTLEKKPMLLFNCNVLEFMTKVMIATHVKNHQKQCFKTE